MLVASLFSALLCSTASMAYNICYFLCGLFGGCDLLWGCDNSNLENIPSFIAFPTTDAMTSDTGPHPMKQYLNQDLLWILWLWPNYIYGDDLPRTPPHTGTLSSPSGCFTMLCCLTYYYFTCVGSSPDGSPIPYQFQLCCIFFNVMSARLLQMHRCAFQKFASPHKEHIMGSVSRPILGIVFLSHFYPQIL